MHCCIIYRGSMVKLESDEFTSSLTSFTPFTVEFLMSYQGNTMQLCFFVFPFTSLNCNEQEAILEK